jgi:hypothetical protein
MRPKGKTPPDAGSFFCSGIFLSRIFPRQRIVANPRPLFYGLRRLQPMQQHKYEPGCCNACFTGEMTLKRFCKAKFSHLSEVLTGKVIIQTWLRTLTGCAPG